MSKLRLIKKHDTYIVQKKFLFFWFNYDVLLYAHNDSEANEAFEEFKNNDPNKTKILS